MNRTIHAVAQDGEFLLIGRNDGLAVHDRTDADRSLLGVYTPRFDDGTTGYVADIVVVDGSIYALTRTDSLAMLRVLSLPFHQYSRLLIPIALSPRRR